MRLMGLGVLVAASAVSLLGLFWAGQLRSAWTAVAVVVLLASGSKLAIGLLSVGRSDAEALPNGEWLGRIKVGIRVLMISGGLAFVAFAFWGLTILGADGTAVQFTLLGATGLFGLYACIFGLLAHVHWSDASISATTYLLTQKRHDWNDLRDIVDAPGQNETRLRFSRSGMARISYYYEGYAQIMTRAKESQPDA